MGYKIFIIDDEQAICDGLLEILNEERYKLFAFTNGKKALEQFNKEMPDLCIVDLKMPDINGFKLIEKVKNIKPDVKVLLLTGSLAETRDSEISKLGIAKVLEKPISRKGILFSVRDTLGETAQKLEEDRPSPPPSPPYKRGNGGSVESKVADAEEEVPFVDNTDEEGYWKKGKILIVDDNEELRLNLKEALNSKNYSASVAKNGIEAVKIIRNDEDFDIILMDIHMPEMDGIEAVKKIKSMSPKTFIIMMTGEADDEEIKNSLEEGGYACMRKPFTIKKLIKSIEWYSEAGKDMKRRYELHEKFQKLPKIKKISINLRRYLESKFSLHRMNIITLILGFISVVIGILMLLFVEYTGHSVSNFANQGISKYENYMGRLLGYLERDEKRELRQ